ncbi:hypothetical protein ACHAWF_014352 [Thalassiosira exigua]
MRRAAHAQKRWLANAERNTSDAIVDANSHLDAHARLFPKFVEEDYEEDDHAMKLCLMSAESARGRVQVLSE